MGFPAVKASCLSRTGHSRRQEWPSGTVSLSRLATPLLSDLASNASFGRCLRGGPLKRHLNLQRPSGACLFAAMASWKTCCAKVSRGARPNYCGSLAWRWYSFHYWSYKGGSVAFDIFMP